MARGKKGKVVAVIPYRRDGHSVDVELRLIHDTHMGGDGGFSYLVDHDSPKMRIEGKEAEEVRKKVYEELKHLLSIQWKQVLVVKTEVSEYSSDVTVGNRGLKIEVDEWEIGTTSTGAQVHRRVPNPKYPKDWIERHREGLPEDPLDSSTGDEDEDEDEDPDDRKQRHTHAISIIDATPENRARVAAIVEAFDRLGLLMANLLSPKQIALTLENVKVLGLPFAPDKKKRP